MLAAEPLARMRFAPPLARWLTSASGLWYLARMLSGPGTGGDRRRSRCVRRALETPGWRRAQVALAWVLTRPGVSSAMFGTTRPEHVRELAWAASAPLPAAVERRISQCLREDEAP